MATTCRLRITDNHEFVNIHDTDDKYVHDSIDEYVIKDLQCIANVEIGTLSENWRDTNLLFFPRGLDYYGDDLSKGKIISMRNDNEIATGNIMGFVGVNNTQIDIASRFSHKDGEDFFLHYMLQKVFSINLFDTKHSSSNHPVFDFLLYLFPYFLKKALSQGIFKKYRRFEYNDSTIRGAISIARHIRENTPFRGSVAYSTREHSYDNEVTQLIRHTIECIKTKTMGTAILNSDSEAKAYVSQIIQVTPTYSAHNRQKIINQNIKPIRHPYFTEYLDLQIICMQILRHEAIKYGQEKDKIYGILFDGAWLWEEYLNTLLAKAGFHHPQNKKRAGGVRMFISDNGERYGQTMYPDFYSDDFVLDAKYKHLNGGVGRDDLYQVVSYMYCLNRRFGGYVYPNNTNHTSITHFKLAGIGCTYKNGDGGLLYIIPFDIPQTQESWKEYIDSMKNSEKSFIERIPRGR